MSSPIIDKIDYDGMFNQVSRLGSSSNKLYFAAGGDKSAPLAKSAGFLTRLFNWSLTNKRLNEDRTTFLNGIKEKYGDGLYEMARVTAEAAGTYGISVATAKQILEMCESLSSLKTTLNDINHLRGGSIALVCGEIILAELASKGGEMNLEGIIGKLEAVLTEFSGNVQLSKVEIDAKDAVLLGKMLASVKEIPSNLATAMIKVAIMSKDTAMRKCCKLQNLLHGCRLLFAGSAQGFDAGIETGMKALEKIAPHLDKLCKKGTPPLMTVARALNAANKNTERDFNFTSGRFRDGGFLKEKVEALLKL